MSSDHPAPGLRAYARVIPEGFIGHHRRVHVAEVTYLRSDQLYVRPRGMHWGFQQLPVHRHPLIKTCLARVGKHDHVGPCQISPIIFGT